MEPPNLIAPKPLMGRPGYLTGEAILRYYGVERGTPLAYLLSYVDFVELARTFGPIGGMGALTALIRDQKARVEAEGVRPWSWTAGTPGPTPGFPSSPGARPWCGGRTSWGWTTWSPTGSGPWGGSGWRSSLGSSGESSSPTTSWTTSSATPSSPPTGSTGWGPTPWRWWGRATPTSRFPTPNPLPRGSPSPWTRGGCRRRWTRPAPRGRTPWSSSPTTGCSWTPPWRSGSGGLTSSSPATPTTSPPGPGGWGRPGSWRGAPPGRP